MFSQFYFYLSGGAVKCPFVWFDFTNKYFVLLHHSEVFRVVVHPQGEISISESFLLEVNEGDVTAVQQQGDFLFILYSSGDICILSYLEIEAQVQFYIFGFLKVISKTVHSCQMLTCQNDCRIVYFSFASDSDQQANDTFCL